MIPGSQAQPSANGMSGEPIRVLHLNSMLTGGGTDEQCLGLVQALQALGQEVVLAGPASRKYSGIIQERSLPFYALPGAKIRFIIAAARLIRARRIQIVHSHHGRDIWPTILAARISGVRPKVVLTRHMAKAPASLASRFLLLRECDALIAVSQFVAKVLREGAHEPESEVEERRHRKALPGDHSKVRVIHNGLDLDRFRPGDASAQREAWGLAAKDYAFGVVGGYDLPRGKGQREFLAAAARVHSAISTARFLIIGSGNMASELQTDITRLGLEGKASLTPYADNMPAAMNALDCLVHPQLGTEAFGMVVLEALACGKRVVASKLDGIPEAFAAGHFEDINPGELVPPGSVEKLADAMLRWATRPGFSEEEKRRLHAHLSASFGWPQSASKVLALYREILA